MKVIIDRIEGEFAVVELSDKTTVNVLKKLFGDAKEGDIFNIEKDEEKRINIDDMFVD